MLRVSFCDAWLQVLHAATAQGIFKCVDGETIAYQSMPCANGQTRDAVGDDCARIVDGRSNASSGFSSNQAHRSR